jgi:putative iron-dependent peroxidase
MKTVQSGILSCETHLARYMTFEVVDIEEAKDCLSQLRNQVDGESVVVGFGLSLVTALGATINGLHNMPVNTAAGLDIPSTPGAMWLWLRGNDRGELFHRSRKLEELLVSAFELSDVVDSFQFDCNRDLSGYVDGTENPEDEDAVNAAIVKGQGEGIDGSSFVAIQQWLHDFDMLDSMTDEEKDNSIGRHISDNEEFDAPEYAHVKRTAQEDFEPEAFVLRRSMPWAEGMSGGLMFVAFGKTFSAFEAQLNRMLGHDDDIQDALFNFTKPVTGAYFWCPPMKDEKLDLSAININ